ncbi:MAG: MFS transporter [Natronosporangium sp.]
MRSLASLLFALAAGYAFGATIACYALAAMLLARLPGSFRARSSTQSAGPRPGRSSGRPDAGSTSSTSMVRAISDGLRYVLEEPLLRSLLWLMMAIGLVSGMVNGVLALWALDVLGVDEALFGVFLLALAAGGVVGSQTAAPIAHRIGRGRTLQLTLLTGGVASLVAAAATSPFLAGAGLAGVGWSSVAFNVVNVSLRMRLSPEAMLGRVTAIFRSGGVGVMVVGAVAGGAIGSAVGLRLPWLLCGIGCLLIAAATARRIGDREVNRALAEAEPARTGQPGHPEVR